MSIGNHEDIMVTVRYGFHNEVNQKYRVSQSFFFINIYINK
jgi:hypothetical protein